jgi:CHAD domain-containing protein
MAEKLDKLKVLRQEAAPKLMKVLTADQYAKLERDFNQWLDQLKQRLLEQK